MSNCLITKIGEQIDCIGVTHDRICERELNLDMDFFLTDCGGVRIKIGWPDINSIAIECYYKPTKKQMNIIRRILHQGNYYTIITAFKTITKFRPIRNFVFNGSLLPK